MGEWQPIETAPKDGTLILVFPFDVVCWQITGDLGYWFADRVSEIDGDYLEEYPTHWMPLPNPPSIK